MDQIDLLKTEVNLNRYDPTPYGQTNTGRVRGRNEDAVLLFDPEASLKRTKGERRVFAVADGVGGKTGGGGGQEASKAIIDGILRYASSGVRISDRKLHEINRQIPRGGSTLALAQQLDNRNDYLINTVGDSPAILIDTRERTVTELTRRDENPDNNGKLFQVMGPAGDAKDAPFRSSHQAVVQLKPGQTLVLATDGLTNYIDKGRIKPSNLLATRNSYAGDNRGFVGELIRMAITQGGSDNITVVSIPFDPRPS